MHRWTRQLNAIKKSLSLLFCLRPVRIMSLKKKQSLTNGPISGSQFTGSQFHGNRWPVLGPTPCRFRSCLAHSSQNSRTPFTHLSGIVSITDVQAWYLSTVPQCCGIGDEAITNPCIAIRTCKVCLDKALRKGKTPVQSPFRVSSFLSYFWPM